MIGHEDDASISETEAAEPEATETPLTEENAPDEDETTVAISSGALNGKEVKEGQTITMKVVSVDDEGVRAVVVTDEGEPESGEGYQEAGPQFDQMAADNAS